MPATYRRLLRRDVVGVCLLVFASDVVIGIQVPIFPLFTTSLGASLGLLGLLTSVLGLARVCSALPVGALSDRFSPKAILIVGQLAFAIACAIYALAPNPYWLIPARAVHGLAMMASFPMGIAYLGDAVEAEDRSAAIGLYTAAMGSGFAVGPLLGSWVSSARGYREAYWLAAAVAIAAALWAWQVLVRRPRPRAGEQRTRSLSIGSVRMLAVIPNMLIACLGNLVMSLSMSGAIFTFFPLYARMAGIGTVTIGSMFAWRALASAVGRIPVGAIAPRLPPRWMLAGVMLIEAVVLIGLSRTSSAALLTGFLVLEGIAFGVFLVTAQTSVADSSGPHNRGTAIGLFSLLGSVGETIGPITFGVIAESQGIAAVFQLMAAICVVSAVAIAVIGTALGSVSQKRREATTADGPVSSIR